MDGFYNNKPKPNIAKQKMKLSDMPPSSFGVPPLEKQNTSNTSRSQAKHDDIAWTGSSKYHVSVVKDGAELCLPRPIKSSDMYGEDWLLAGFVNQNENHYFTAGSEIRIAMSGTGWGFVQMPHQIYSRKVEDSGRIPGIATTREALRNQHNEPQAQYLNPVSVRGGDYKGKGRTEMKLSAWGAPVSYKHDEEAEIVAWEIHTDSFIARGDPGAVFLGLVVLIKTIDLPKYKIYADGWRAGDVVGFDPPWYRKLWDEIVN